MDKKIASKIEAYKKARNMDNALEARWLTRFLELLAFKKEYGHTNVPDGYEKNRSLAYWIQRQRHLHTIKKIDTLREELLKLAGFQFRILSHHDWEEMFEKLILFKEIYGHVHITEDCEDRQLHDWLVYQRKLSWRGQLDDEKFDRLRSLGVDMRNKTAGYWNKMFNELVRFKKENGHLHVCKHFGAGKQLINFVKVNRKNKDTMTWERREKLNAIGFVWNPGKEVTRMLNRLRADEAWMARLEELKTYKQKFGTSRLVIRKGEYFGLGNWCSAQRSQKEKLSEKRFKLLEQIGFWEDNNR